MVKKNILLIGDYDPEYPRNRVLISVIKKYFSFEEYNFVKKNFFNFIKFIFILFKIGKNKDYIFFVSFSHYFAPALWLFKFFHPKKTIVFDAFISIYDSFVYDRQLVEKKSIKALYYYLLDFILCHSCDVFLFDTIEHQNYFIKTFKISSRKKKIIMPVCVDFELIHNIEKKNITPGDGFDIFFYGSYIPLQGIEYIVQAANILKENKKLRFILLGSGQEYNKILSLVKDLSLSNVYFFQKTDYSSIISLIKSSHLCLGIFGHSAKASRVVPNKVLESLAATKILITGKNNALARYFHDNEDVIFCEMANAKDLADKISYVFKNYQQLQYIGKNGQGKVKKYFSVKILEDIILKNFYEIS